MTLQGSLDDLPLPDVIQLFAVSGKTGRVDLANGDETGHIFLRSGKIVHAVTGSVQGEDAIYQLVNWPTGDFRFSPGEEPARTTIDKTNDSLLIEAAHRVDQWNELSKSLDADSVPLLCPSTSSVESLRAEHWNLACWIDGRRSLAELEAAFATSSGDLARLLQDLVASGRVLLQRDPIREHREHLATMDSEQIGVLIRTFDALARFSDTPHPELDRNLAFCQGELLEGRRLDALGDLVRGHGRVLSEKGGVVVLQSFLEEVREILKRELA